MRTSYSSIQTYLQCPQKYKFQEIDKIRAPKSKEAIFGTLVHGTLRFMFERNPLFPTLDETLAHFRERWPELEVWNQESVRDPLKRQWNEEELNLHFDEGVRILKNFYQKNLPWNYTVVDLESRFQIEIRDEKTGRAHVLAGVIDRIDKTADERYEIIDYKTSKKMPPQEQVNRDFQLSLYGTALQERWPHITSDKIRLSLYFVKHGEKLSTSPTPESAAKTKERALGVINAIEDRVSAGKTFEPSPSALCNWCAYRPMCPAWRHLYKKQGTENREQEGADKIIQEYLDIKKQERENKKRLAELQRRIKEYMERENVTRVFADQGVIAQKTIQRFEYDMEKVRAILSPFGKGEEMLSADNTKIKKILGELPAEARAAMASARILRKEYASLAATLKKQERPSSAAPQPSAAESAPEPNPATNKESETNSLLDPL